MDTVDDDILNFSIDYVPLSEIEVVVQDNIVMDDVDEVEKVYLSLDNVYMNNFSNEQFSYDDKTDIATFERALETSEYAEDTPGVPTADPVSYKDIPKKGKKKRRKAGKYKRKKSIPARTNIVKSLWETDILSPIKQEIEDTGYANVKKQQNKAMRKDYTPTHQNVLPGVNTTRGENDYQMQVDQGFIDQRLNRSSKTQKKVGRKNKQKKSLKPIGPKASARVAVKYKTKKTYGGVKKVNKKKSPVRNKMNGTNLEKNSKRAESSTQPNRVTVEKDEKKKTFQKSDTFVPVFKRDLLKKSLAAELNIIDFTTEHPVISTISHSGQKELSRKSPKKQHQNEDGERKLSLRTGNKLKPSWAKTRGNTGKQTDVTSSKNKSSNVETPVEQLKTPERANKQNGDTFTVLREHSKPSPNGDISQITKDGTQITYKSKQSELSNETENTLQQKKKKKKKRRPPKWGGFAGAERRRKRRGKKRGFIKKKKKKKKN